MRIIDSYLLRQFLRIFVICFLSVTGLFAVLDAFTNLDEFLKFAEKQGNLLTIMGGYYSYRSVDLFDRLSGVLVLTAAMFTLTWFQRFNELTALAAAGISPARISKPLVGAALVISLLAASSRELLIPRIRDRLSRNARDLGGERAVEMRPRFDNQTEIFIRGQRTFANEQRIHQPDFLLPLALQRYSRKLAAHEAYYTPPRQDRPGGYWLKNVTLPKQLAEKPSISHNGMPVILTPHDNAWLAPTDCFVVSQVDFEQLTGGQSWRDYSSTAALIQGLRNRSLDFGADVRVLIHARIVRPLLDMTLLFLGLPLIVARENRNMFMAVGQCVLVVSGFLLVVVGSQYLGSVYLLNPALAAWLPLMIFVPLAAIVSEPLLA